MKLRRLTAAAASVAVTAAGLAVAAPPASAGDKEGLDTRSLAKVLAADGSGFDRNAHDFDILDNAVTAVLAAKPHSPVAVLADGRTRLTAFLPTDAAFRGLVADLAGKEFPRERRVFRTLARTAGVDTVEAFLLYHVVPGQRINYRTAQQADGARLTTALGPKVRVNVRKNGAVYLRDRDRDAANAKVLPALRNINKGNRQIAHGISQVLRPIDL